jgi:hypothetical protein
MPKEMVSLLKLTPETAKMLVERNLDTRSGVGLRIGRVIETKETGDELWPFECRVRLIQEFSTGIDYLIKPTITDDGFAVFQVSQQSGALDEFMQFVGKEHVLKEDGEVHTHVARFLLQLAEPTRRGVSFTYAFDHTTKSFSTSLSSGVDQVYGTQLVEAIMVLRDLHRWTKTLVEFANWLHHDVWEVPALLPGEPEPIPLYGDPGPEEL